MKYHPIPISMRQTILALSLSLFAGYAHALAYYDAFADALLSIDTITNLNNPGDNSVLSVDGNVYTENLGKTEHGKVESSYYGVIDLQSSTASDPGLLNQVSDIHGNVYPTISGSLADTVYSSLGEFNLRNLSTTDTVQIDFSLKFNIEANASITRPGNENAYAEAFVRLIDTLGQVYLDQTISADAKGVLAPPHDAMDDTLLFSITLLPDTLQTSNESFNRITLNVSARGNAESIPEPSTIFLFASGLIGMVNWSRRLRLSLF